MKAEIIKETTNTIYKDENGCVIDDITFVYDDSTRSFHSVGKIGIGFINGTPIHKYIDGYIEIWKRFSGDIIDILFYPDENTYFYFNYSKGKMETLSSDKVFEMPIHNLPERKRRMKTERGKPQYLYQISTMRKMSGVKTRWKTGLSDELKEFIETSTELEEIMIREDNNQNNGNNNEQE